MCKQEEQEEGIDWYPADLAVAWARTRYTSWLILLMRVVTTEHSRAPMPKVKSADCECLALTCKVAGHVMGKLMGTPL